MSTVTAPLTYLFSAFFEGGAIISQTAEDVSTVDETKSAYYDVEEKSKEDPLVQFSLVGVNNNGGNDLIIVDLRSGRFYANGVDFSMEGQDEVLTDRQLIYFRENLQHQVIGEEAGASYVSRYFIGYKGKNEKGRSVQKVLNVRA
jgi:hypothetical protein